MIPRILYEKMNELANLRRITNSEASEIQDTIRQYINPKYSVCLRCSSQLKFGQKIILNWLSQQTITDDITDIVKEDIILDEIPSITPPEVVEVGCTSCKKKTTTPKKTKQ